MDMILKNLLNKSKVIVFDFDDTFASTEKYSWQAHNKSLERYGVYLTDEHIKKYIGNNDKVIFSMIEKDFNIKLDFEKHFQDRIDNYVQIILESDLKPNGFVIDIINNYYKEKPIYILTSNSGMAINKILKKWDLDNKIERIYSVIETSISKENYIKESQQYFGCSSDKLIMFEDSHKTLTMSKKYNVKTVYVKTELNLNPNSEFDFVIEN